MVVGYHHFRKPPYVSIAFQALLEFSRIIHPTSIVFASMLASQGWPQPWPGKTHAEYEMSKKTYAPKNIKVIMPLIQQVCTLCMCMIEAMMHLKRSDDVCRNCRSMTPVYMPCKGSIVLNAIKGRQYGANQENQECNRPHLTLNIESVMLAN